MDKTFLANGQRRTVSPLNEISTMWETKPRMTPQKTSRLLMGPEHVTRLKTLQAVWLWWIRVPVPSQKEACEAYHLCISQCSTLKGKMQRKKEQDRTYDRRSFVHNHRYYYTCTYSLISQWHCINSRGNIWCFFSYLTDKGRQDAPVHFYYTFYML
jgi:hypothetical protein